MASNRDGDEGSRVILGLTGSIGIVKAPAIVSCLLKAGVRTRVVMTPAATELGSPNAFAALTGQTVGTDLTEALNAAEIQHIAWAQWADAILIAPASASTIGKLACGIADNLLTTMMLAATCPTMIVPAMNPNMYLHPAVQENLERLRNRGMHIMEPAEGRLACGAVGPGKLPEPDEIVATFLRILERPSDCGRLNRVRVLVTAGPTVEDIDPVRFLSNRSSGRMGYALAAAARDMGADVTLVTGPVSIDPPAGVEVVQVRSAEDMRRAVMERAPRDDVIIGCAAVADYRPERILEHKTAKKEQTDIHLVRTPDILAELGQNKAFYLVGFAAQTRAVIERAREKLRLKNLDMIVANDVSSKEVGMESMDNEVTILRPDRKDVHLERAAKERIAREIMLEIAADLELRR